jgi:hypothetical protein
MKPATTDRFWQHFRALPEPIQAAAVAAFELWKVNPHHPGLYFKPVRGVEGLYPVRKGQHRRAAGGRRDHTICWMWIGSHADDDSYLGRL